MNPFGYSINNVFAVSEKLKEAFIFESLSCIIRISAIAIGVYLQDFILAVAIFSLTSAFTYFILYIWSMKIAQSKLSFYFQSDFIALGLSIFCFFPLFLITYNIINNDKSTTILLCSLSFVLLFFYYIFYFIDLKKRKFINIRNFL